MRRKTVQEFFSKEHFGGDSIPKELKGEISILYELGLEEYEINYILYLRAKEKARLKWGG